MKQIFFTLFLTVFSLACHATTIDEIDREITKYPWYQEVHATDAGNYEGCKTQACNIRRQKYNTRARVAAFLESNNLYTAADTRYCNKAESVKLYGLNSDCFIGEPRQNEALLKVLRTKKVRDVLAKMSPWVIRNGMDGKLNTAKDSLTSVKQACHNGDEFRCKEIPAREEYAKKLDSLRRWSSDKTLSKNRVFLS